MSLSSTSAPQAHEDCRIGEWISGAVGTADSPTARLQLLRLWPRADGWDEVPLRLFGALGDSHRYADLYLRPAEGDSFQLRTASGQPRGRIRFECQGEALLSLWDDPKGERHRARWHRPPEGYTPARQQQPQRLRQRLQPQFGRKVWRISAESTHTCEVQHFEPGDPRYAALNTVLWENYLDALQTLDTCRLRDAGNDELYADESCVAPRVLAMGDRYATVRYTRMACDVLRYPGNMRYYYWDTVKIDTAQSAFESPPQLFKGSEVRGPHDQRWLDDRWTFQPLSTPRVRLLREAGKECKPFMQEDLQDGGYVFAAPSGLWVIVAAQHIHCTSESLFSWPELEPSLSPLGRKLRQDFAPELSLEDWKDALRRSAGSEPLHYQDYDRRQRVDEPGLPFSPFDDE